MSFRADMAARRAAMQMERRESRIIYRRISILPGPTPQPNPPVWAAPITTLAAEVGASVLTLVGAMLQGRLLAGDKIQVGSKRFLVGATATGEANPDTTGSNDLYRMQIQLSAPLAAPVEAGASASFIFGADHHVAAKVAPSIKRAVTEAGTLVVIRNFLVLVSPISLPFAPDLRDRVILPAAGPLERTIVSIGPQTIGDGVALYRLEVL